MKPYLNNVGKPVRGQGSNQTKNVTDKMIGQFVFGEKEKRIILKDE